MMSKVAVITGASKGIGAATAKAFAKAGYDVVVNYFHSQKEAEQVAQDCEALGVKAITVQADCNKEADIQKLADETAKVFGKVDVLVNNYGYSTEPDFDVISQSEVTESLTNNIVSTVIATRIFVNGYLQEKSVVLNVSSIYGLEQGGRTSLPIYSASKAAVINFTQTMAQRYAPNIRFNVVAPGFTKTPAWDGVSDEYLEACFDETLQHEWVEAEDIAEALLFLANATHVNAETIIVDAGRSKK